MKLTTEDLLWLWYLEMLSEYSWEELCELESENEY